MASIFTAYSPLLPDLSNDRAATTAVVLSSPSIRPRPGQGTLARIFSISEVVKARIVCVRIWLDPNRKKTTKMLGIFVLIFGSLRTPQIHSKFNLLYAGSKNV